MIKILLLGLGIIYWLAIVRGHFGFVLWMSGIYATVYVLAHRLGAA
jgi:hypothetical protein